MTLVFHVYFLLFPMPSVSVRDCIIVFTFFGLTLFFVYCSTLTFHVRRVLPMSRLYAPKQECILIFFLMLPSVVRPTSFSQCQTRLPNTIRCCMCFFLMSPADSCSNFVFHVFLLLPMPSASTRDRNVFIFFYLMFRWFHVFFCCVAQFAFSIPCCFAS